MPRHTMRSIRSSFCVKARRGGHRRRTAVFDLLPSRVELTFARRCSSKKTHRKSGSSVARARSVPLASVVQEDMLPEFKLDVQELNLPMWTPPAHAQVLIWSAPHSSLALALAFGCFVCVVWSGCPAATGRLRAPLGAQLLLGGEPAALSTHFVFGGSGRGAGRVSEN